MLDIPNITVVEQLERYARGLKTYIWKELCTEDATPLGELMRNGERVEMAHLRFGKQAPKFGTSVKTTQSKVGEPAPMEIGNIQLKKVTAAERDQCL